MFGPAGVLALQQDGQIDVQGLCDPRHHEQAGVPLPSFDAANIGEVDLRIEGELFLRQLSGLPQPPHIPAHNDAPVFHRRDGR